MKKIFAIVAAALLSIASMSAQIPQGLSYQAVIRDGSGNVVINKELNVQISVLKGSIDGAAVYTEIHQATTTANGVLTLEVGDGTTTDDFSAIDWSKGPYFINSSVELNGKNISVTSQLLSVPYALFAQKSLVAEKVDADFLQEMIDSRIKKAFAERDSATRVADSIAAVEDSIVAAKLDSIAAVEDSIAAARADSIAAAKADSIVAARADSIAAAKADSIVAAKLDSIAAAKDSADKELLSQSAAKNGVLPGKFSIGDNNMVHFSKGVLQYHEKKNIWRFAQSQFDTIGRSYKDYWMAPVDDWVDRFEFATGGNYYPESPYYSIPFTRDMSDSYLFESDWGLNPIINGGNKSDQWFTLSWLEWEYLFYERANADSLYSKATVDGMKGYVLLPDAWLTPIDVKFKPRASDTVNVYDKIAWAKMESLGAVFFPATDYWSNMGEGSYLHFNIDHEYPVNSGLFDYKNNFVVNEGSIRTPKSVRLVISDNKAGDVMGGEPVENEDCEYGDVLPIVPNNYLPDDNADLTNVDMTEGLLNGKFSVSDSRQISFSQGNLQYNSEKKVWRFAEKQYEKIQKQGFWSSNADVKDGWRDVFCWASSGYACDPEHVFWYDDAFGLGQNDIAGTKYDWGVNNAISNGGNVPNIWRSLTKDEWKYLMSRKKEDKPLCFPAVVNGVDGMVLLPDNWSSSLDFSYVDQISDVYEWKGYDNNVFDKAQWSNMETQGAVFLPSAGLAAFNYVFDAADVGASSWYDGGYWSSSADGKEKACVMRIEVHSFGETYENFNRSLYRVDAISGVSSRGVGYSVRLVRDVK